MQICHNLLRVIFMLSTIVAVTDCCSSRILLLKEHTLKIMHQHKMQQYEHGHQLQPPQEKYQQHVHGHVAAARDFSKNHTASNADDEMSADDQTGPGESPLSGNNNGGHLDRPPPAHPGRSDASTALPALADVYRANELITDTAVREKHADDPKYHLIDIYYTIMSDVLSFACTGQFLTDFCLNNGRCFRYPVGNHSFFSCECADGFVGERCESKSVNGVFVPTTSALDTKPPKVLTARMVFSFPMLIALTLIYMFFGMIVVFKCQPQKRLQHNRTTGATGMLCA